MIPSKYFDGEVWGLMWFKLKDPREQRPPTADEIEALAITYRLAEMEEGDRPAKRGPNPKLGSPSEGSP